jgi:hypothetical protein
MGNSRKEDRKMDKTEEKNIGDWHKKHGLDCAPIGTENIEEIDMGWLMNECKQELAKAIHDYTKLEESDKNLNDIIGLLDDIRSHSDALNHYYKIKQKTSPIASEEWGKVNNSLGHLCKAVGCFMDTLPKMELYKESKGYVIALPESQDLEPVEIEDPHNEEEILRKAFDLLLQYKAMYLPF